jgi:spectinomycin phosphotransferase
MLTPPDISNDAIASHVREVWGPHIRQVTFLPIGADEFAAVYRLDAEDGAAYFLKLKWRAFDEVTVALPAFLHAQGILPVMTPIATTASRLWTSAHGFQWILYPFFEGRTGYQATLSNRQWVTFGRTLRAVHDTVLPSALDRLVPREDYSPPWRDVVRAYDQEVDTRPHADPAAVALADFWRTKRDDIREMVDRTERLAQILRQRGLPFVLCHTDLHPGNVLLGPHAEFAIVDWDAPLFAPKERDLMSLGGGVGPAWNDPHEDALFYEGYGPAAIDLEALAYYRYQRIVDDLAAYGAQIFEVRTSPEDRRDGLRRFMGNWLPGHVLDVAHQTYAQIPRLP